MTYVAPIASDSTVTIPGSSGLSSLSFLPRRFLRADFFPLHSLLSLAGLMGIAYGVITTAGAAADVTDANTVAGAFV